MATIINGHGDRKDGDDATFVPAGTSVAFYGDTDKLLPDALALAAVASGAIGSPNERFDAGDAIWNYHLYELEDAGIAQVMQLDRGGNTMVFIGPDVPDDTPFCTDLAGCEERGAHNCQGILGRYSGELIVLACRGVEGQDAETSSDFGSDEDDPLHDLQAQLDEWLEGFDGRVKADPAAAEAEFDALPEGTKTLLMPDESIASWNQARWVRHYADRDDFDGFIGQLRSSGVDSDLLKDWFADVPAYADSLFFLIVGNMRGDFEATIGSLPSDQAAALTAIEQMLERWKTGVPEDIDAIESLLGFSVDEGRLQGYGPFRELQAHVQQTLQQLEQQYQPAPEAG